MSAVPRCSFDCGPPRCREFALNWSIDDDDTSPLVLRVSFCLRWPSAWHRGYGKDGEVHIFSVDYLRDESRTCKRWRSFDAPPPILNRILETLEREELTP